MLVLPPSSHQFSGSGDGEGEWVRRSRLKGAMVD
jgi:hypothetical protein